jgi:hypothetical protein
MGEKLFYYFEDPNMGGTSLFSFLVLYFAPDPLLAPIKFINFASYFRTGYCFSYKNLD